MSERDLSSFYVWIDTEYSELDLDRAVLLQVAVVITTAGLVRCVPPEEDFRVFVRLPPGKRLSPWVRERIPAVVAACRSEHAIPVEQVNRRLGRYLDRVLGPSPASVRHRPVLAGNSVHADWAMARRYLPALLRRLHYRHLDVTALKLEWQRAGEGPGFDKEDPALVRRHDPSARLPPTGAHDAYYDVQASMAELAFYRAHLLRRPRKR